MDGVNGKEACPSGADLRCENPPGSETRRLSLPRRGISFRSSRSDSDSTPESLGCWMGD